jgi:two-component system, sensor histidine kinase SagS
VRDVAKGQGVFEKVAGRVMDRAAELPRDMDERAVASQELERLKGNFVAVVSHELKTPLTSIKAGVETLRAGWGSIDDDIKFELLDTIGHQCDRLMHMIGQVLFMSGIEGGDLSLSSTTFSLPDLARDVAHRMRARNRSRELRLEAGSGVLTTGDRVRLTEVATTLVDNALAFTDGRVLVRVTQEPGRALLHVIDDGPGLDTESMQKLVDNPFSQADSSTTRAVGGLGVSLHIARQILHASGGGLQVRSSPAGGSTFTMVLPIPIHGDGRAV